MLSAIKSGQKVFIDSNILIYHFLGLNDNATVFLQRCERKEIIAHASVIVLAEIWHRLMIAEVIETYNISPGKAVSYLKSHPRIVKELAKCHIAIESIPKLNIKVWPLTKKIFTSAQLIIKQHGLLTNDALNLALMKSHGIKNIATNDRDFERLDIFVNRP